MFYKNWKECAWNNLDDDKDNGLIKVKGTCRLQNSPYFSARVGLNLARKGSGTSVKITRGIGEKSKELAFIRRDLY